MMIIVIVMMVVMNLGPQHAQMEGVIILIRIILWLLKHWLGCSLVLKDKGTSTDKRIVNIV